jgi:histidyl-tRNA synthetase
MIYEPETVKGFRDFLPPESMIREKIKEVAKKYYKLFGFLPVETPMIEFDELMRSDTLGEEDEAVRDRYRLKDRGGRNLGLRYEFTFQLKRLFKQNPNLKLPFKKYQIGENFRDEPTRIGRTRQFTQCDIDIIGDPSIKADAECLAVVSEIFKELNISPVIQINNRKLLNSILESVKIKEKEQVMRELDKLEKLGEDTVKSNLRKYADPNQIITLFKLIEKPLDFFVKNLFEGSKEIQEIQELSKPYGLKIVFSPGMIRGFEYYTGNIFEFMKGKSAICGGGRYDNSVGKYLGKKIPAVGISFSLEGLMGLCSEELSKLKLQKTSKALIISLKKDKEAIKLSQKFRKSNIATETSFSKPSRALEYSNAKQIPFAIFIGEAEITNKKFTLKDLKSGEEKLLSEKQIISKLKK